LDVSGASRANERKWGRPEEGEETKKTKMVLVHIGGKRGVGQREKGERNPVQGCPATRPVFPYSFIFIKTN